MHQTVHSVVISDLVLGFEMSDFVDNCLFGIFRTGH